MLFFTAQLRPSTTGKASPAVCDESMMVSIITFGDDTCQQQPGSVTRYSNSFGALTDYVRGDGAVMASGACSDGLESGCPPKKFRWTQDLN